MVSSSATPVQHTARRGGRDPETVELSARPDGTFGALSSDGATIYSVRPVGPERGYSCTCRGYTARETCCHTLAAAAARTCAWCDHVGAEVRTYRNGWDNGAELSLCAACHPQKEAK
jgi:hypothetical protein